MERDLEFAYSSNTINKIDNEYSKLDSHPNKTVTETNLVSQMDDDKSISFLTIENKMKNYESDYKINLKIFRKRF